MTTKAKSDKKKTIIHLLNKKMSYFVNFSSSQTHSTPHLMPSEGFLIFQNDAFSAAQKKKKQTKTVIL